MSQKTVRLLLVNNRKSHTLFQMLLKSSTLDLQGQYCNRNCIASSFLGFLVLFGSVCALSWLCMVTVVYFVFMLFLCLKFLGFMLFRWDTYTKTSDVGEHWFCAGSGRCLDKADQLVFTAKWPGTVLGSIHDSVPSGDRRWIKFFLFTRWRHYSWWKFEISDSF